MFYNLKGRRVNKNISKFVINWKAKSKSKIQKETKEFLYPFWKNKVCYEEMVCAGTRLSLDFFNLTDRVAIEVHGRQHEEFVEHFQGHKLNFLAQCERDARKQDWCEKNKIQLIEIYTEDFPLTKEFFNDIHNYTL